MIPKIRTAYTTERSSLDFTGELDRTKQSFKDECDINNILRKYVKTGAVTHFAKHAATYGDCPSIDFREAMETIRTAKEMFADLPAEIRKHFGNDPAAFLDFVQNPDNLDDMREMGLAKPKAPQPPPPQPGTPATPPPPK